MTSPDPLHVELQTVLDQVWIDLPDQPQLESSLDISGGRGVFSRVFAVDLKWPASAAGLEPAPTPHPTSVVIKLAAFGANREAAISSGAYEREALAYQHLLRNSPIASPICHGVSPCVDGAIDFVLEDLRSGRSVGQVEGLRAVDASAIVQELGRWHHASRRPQLEALGNSVKLRRSTPRLLPQQGLLKGLQTLREEWSDLLSEQQIQNFTRLVERRSDLVDAFDQNPVSLCHGDVRADNLIFDYKGKQVVFYDWQQTAVQLGEADLAWLCATSLEPAVRRGLERELCQLFADASGEPNSPTWDRYRSALVLPGLTVLFLAQRQLETKQAHRFVSTSLTRIATAIDDHELANE